MTDEGLWKVLLLLSGYYIARYGKMEMRKQETDRRSGKKICFSVPTDASSVLNDVVSVLLRDRRFFTDVDEIRSLLMNNSGRRVLPANRKSLGRFISVTCSTFHLSSVLKVRADIFHPSVSLVEESQQCKA